MKGPITLSILAIGLTSPSDAFKMSRMTRPSFIRDALHKETTSTALYESSLRNIGSEYQDFRETSTHEEFASLTVDTEPRLVAARQVAAEAKPKKVGKAPAHQEGIFSPVVFALKNAMGDDKLNKLRGKVIALHSDVINSFVDSANTIVGQAVLVNLFSLADQNRDGELQKEELAAALQTLGFSWLKEKQVSGILERADKNQNGALDLEEFLKEAPKTLKTNLVKLAKKNGGELGFLV